VTVSDVADSEIDTYILMAQDYIDSALSREYAVPFDPVPRQVRWIAADIAAYYLMRDFPNKVFADDRDHIKADYEAALKALKSGDSELIGVDRLDTSTAATVYFTQVSSSPAARWTSDRAGYDVI
jgi:phage gp36-like protein